MLSVNSYATVLTREGVTDPSRLSPQGQIEFYTNRRGKGKSSTSKPTTHPKGGKVNRKRLARLHARQSARTKTLESNKNINPLAYRMPGSNTK